MPRYGGVGQRRKGIRHDTANETSAKKSRLQVQQVSAAKAKKRLYDTREVKKLGNKKCLSSWVAAEKGLDTAQVKLESSLELWSTPSVQEKEI